MCDHVAQFRIPALSFVDLTSSGLEFFPLMMLSRQRRLEQLIPDPGPILLLLRVGVGPGRPFKPQPCLHSQLIQDVGRIDGTRLERRPSVQRLASFATSLSAF